MPTEATEEAAPRRPLTTAEAVARQLRSSVDRIAEHLPLVHTSDDPEAVHQVRVGIRRLRSDLRTLAPLVAEDDQVRMDELQADLRLVFVALGRSRDLDVLADRMAADPLDVGGTAAAWDLLVARVDADRRQARRQVSQVLSGEWALGILGRAAVVAGSPPLQPDVADTSARRSLGRLARAQVHRLRRAARRVGDPPGAEDLHRLRRRAKRARYACEAAAAVDGHRLDRAVAALERVQDHLGAHQDLVEGQARLVEVVERGDPPLAFVAGRLAQRDAHRAESLRACWPAVWARVERDLRKVDR